jgi:alanine racemase
MLEDEHEAARLDIDLAALVRNWKLLKATHLGQDCSAVVKADAYGLGVDHVAAALADAGCRHFFVATLDEAIHLRQVLTSQFIYVFNGVQAGEETGFLDYNILPVLNNMPQFERWEAAAQSVEAAGSVLHADTGMHRLGFSLDEAEKLAMEPERLAKAQVRMVMSHLACASEPEHPMNGQQLQSFTHIRKCFPTLTASFANSAGIFMHKRFHHELGRPGCALYGINPYHQARPTPVEAVVQLSAPVLQRHRVSAQDAAVGYGATPIAEGSELATLAIGYADGLPRNLTDGKACVWFGDHAAPIVGRISMDLITVDVSHVPAELCQNGERASIIGPKQDVNQLAECAGTIGYEILTGLKARITRHYHYDPVRN